MAQPIGEILQQWADLDIFFYALPFLLIFALVYAILYKVNIMGKRGGDDANKFKGPYAIIAAAIALMSLQFDFVSVFFQVIFPKVGVGLSILLAAMILGGLFLDFSTEKRGAASVMFFGLGAAIFVWVVLTSINDYSWWEGSWWQQNMPAIIAIAILIIFVGVITSSGSDSKETPWVLRQVGEDGQFK